MPIDRKPAEVHPGDYTSSLPWERLRGETDRQWVAFVLYRDMGPDKRSISLVCQKLRCGRSKIAHWSGEMNWISRCEAWDAYCDKKKRKAQEQAIERMSARHARAAGMLIKRALERLMGETNDLGEVVGQLQLKEIDAGDLVKMISEGAKLERLSRGQPDSVSEVKADVTIKPSQDRLTAIISELNIRRRAYEDAHGDGALESGTGLAELPMETEREAGADPSDE